MRRYFFFLIVIALLAANCVSIRPLYSAQEVELYSKAFHLYSSAHYAESESVLTQLISVNDKNVYAYLLRSMVRRLLVKPDLAIADLLAAQQLEPNNATVYYNLGCVYDSLGQYADAIANYTKAIQLDPVFADAYLNRANAYIRVDNSPAALADYKIFITMADDQKEGIIRVIEILEKN
jgi:tetratricopeptide (TPR) repeat protein